MVNHYIAYLKKDGKTIRETGGYDLDEVVARAMELMSELKADRVDIVENGVKIVQSFS